MADPRPRPSSEPQPEVVSPATACDLAASDPEAIGVLAGRPLLAIDLDGASPVEADLVARRLAEVPAVVVGLTHDPAPFALTPPRCDVLLAAAPASAPPWRSCPEGLDAALGAVAAGVARAPQAATVLVQVLRRGRGASLDAALTIESLAYGVLQSGPEHRAWLAARAPDHGRGGGLAGEPVGVERRGDTLAVTLRRPEVRNAVDVATRDGLVAAFDLAARDGTIGRVELRGDGPDFCSGGDLREFGTLPDPATGHLVRSTRSPARALAACADRTTVFVHGASVGAGLELAALADRVVATPDATFLLPELGLGLIPGAGGTATLPRRIGPELTAWLALTTTPIDAPTALHWHLIDHITP